MYKSVASPSLNEGFQEQMLTVKEIHLKENQLDAQFIFSTFRQTPLHVSGTSTVHHQEVHRMDTTIGTWLPSQDNRQSPKKNNKHQLLYPYGVSPDVGL
jgi:hypothetical protein